MELVADGAAVLARLLGREALSWRLLSRLRAAADAVLPGGLGPTTGRADAHGGHGIIPPLRYHNGNTTASVTTTVTPLTARDGPRQEARRVAPTDGSVG